MELANAAEQAVLHLVGLICRHPELQRHVNTLNMLSEQLELLPLNYKNDTWTNLVLVQMYQILIDDKIYEDASALIESVLGVMKKTLICSNILKIQESEQRFISLLQW